VIVSSEVASQRLFGVFTTDDPESFARAAGASLHVPVIIEGAKILIG
jgi:ferric-dicitrate binding protein FerR (iron transport regulator)